ncbi:hypothetical protein ACFWNK_19660 [Streptomyces sp. NPDC058417]|uniref:hypothetical protein n=1 Tax=unclassified Streptomyces TaxID=2593676 RepID=UPI0036512C17
MSTIPEAEPARPWRAEDGPPPAVWTWPQGDRPALRVWSEGRWRYAAVLARLDGADGAVHYQVLVSLPGEPPQTIRTYRWGHPGLRKCHGSGSTPSLAVDERRQGGMPRAPRRQA